MRKFELEQFRVNFKTFSPSLEIELSDLSSSLGHVEQYTVSYVTATYNLACILVCGVVDEVNYRLAEGSNAVAVFVEARDTEHCG